MSARRPAPRKTAPAAKRATAKPTTAKAKVSKAKVSKAVTKNAAPEKTSKPKTAETSLPRSLETYAKKRNFAVTSEPAPSPVSKAPDGPPTFMVHKHDATRLHYDLRLEMDGALASWAVPRGPSFNPTDRRLAVQTEDHPLEYGSFEGRIPEGEYGAGDSLIWDRGVYDTVPPGQASAMRKKGHVEFVLAGEKLQGRWHLIRTRSRGGKAEWLLFKAKDEFASTNFDVVAERPESVVSGRRVTRGPTPVDVRRAPGDPVSLLLRIWPPPLPHPVGKKRVDAKDYIFEGQADGIRTLIALSGGRVALQSEAGRDLAAANPAIVKGLASLKLVDAIFDGEIVNRPDPKLILHDVPWLDARDMRERPLEERQEILRTLPLSSKGIVAAAPVFEKTSLDDALAAAKIQGFPYVAARRRRSTYTAKDKNSWLVVATRGQHTTK